MAELPLTQVMNPDSGCGATTVEAQIIGFLIINDVKYPLRLGQTKIGRDRMVCSIVLNNSVLSKTHAVIESFGPDATVIYDLNSTNKTRLGQMVLMPEVRYHLADGAQITLGNIPATFEIRREKIVSKIEEEPQSQSMLGSIEGDAGNSPHYSNSGKTNISSNQKAATTAPVILAKKAVPSNTGKIVPDNVFDVVTQAPFGDVPSDDREKNIKSEEEEEGSSSSQKENEFHWKEEKKINLRLQNKSVVNEKNLETSPLSSNIYDAATQCPVVFEAETQLFKQPQLFTPTRSSDIFDQPTQYPLPSEKFVVPNAKKNRADISDIYEEETQARPNSSVNSDVMNTSHIFDVNTQFRDNDLSDSMIDESHLNDSSAVFDVATQCPLGKNITRFSCASPNETNTSHASDIFNAATQCPVNDSSYPNDDIFDALTQCPVETSKKCDFNSSGVFEAETQCPMPTKGVKSFKEPNSSVIDLNKVVHAQSEPFYNRIFEEETQAVGTKISRKKTKTMVVTKDGEISPKSLLDDGEDEVLCSFMSVNSPHLNPAKLKQEMDDSSSTINSEDSLNDVMKTGSKPKGVKKEQEVKRKNDNGNTIAAEFFNGDESVLILEDHTPKGKPAKLRECEDLEVTQVYQKKPATVIEDDLCTQIFKKNKESSLPKSVTTIDIDSGDETESDLEAELDNFKVPPIVAAATSKKKNEDMPAQPVVTTNKVNDWMEDLIPTQVFREDSAAKPPSDTAKPDHEEPIRKTRQDESDNDDLIPTQLYRPKTLKRAHVLADSSGDETESDLEIESSGAPSPRNFLAEEMSIQTPSTLDSDKFVIDSRSSSPSMLTDETKKSKLEENKNLDNDLGKNLNCGDMELDFTEKLPDTERIFPGESVPVVIGLGSRNAGKVSCTEKLPDTQKIDFNGKLLGGMMNYGAGDVCPIELECTERLPGGDTQSFDCQSKVLGSAKIPVANTELEATEKLADTQKLDLLPIKTHLSVPDSDSDATDCEEADSGSVFKTPMRVVSDDDSDWGMLSLELPSTQDFHANLPKGTPKKFMSPLFKQDSAMKRAREAEFNDGFRNKKFKRIDFDDSDFSDSDWSRMSLELPSTPDFKRAIEMNKFNSPAKSFYGSSPIKSLQFTPVKTSSIVRNNSVSSVSEMSRENTPVKGLKSDTEPEVLSSEPEAGPSILSNESWSGKSSPLLMSRSSRPRRNTKATWKIQLKTKEEKSTKRVFKSNLISEFGNSVRSSSPSSCVSENILTSDSECSSSEQGLVQSRKKQKTEEPEPAPALPVAVPVPSYFADSAAHVLFTGFEEDDQIEIVTKLGGVKTNEVKDGNVLVADKVRRTVKFLSAIGLGIPIVSPNWLFRCKQMNRFVDPWDFVLVDFEAETKWKFNLKRSLEQSKKSKLLKGFTVYATKNAKPPPIELSPIVECCGGNFLFEQPVVWPEKSLIVTCMDDHDLWPRSKQRCIRIVHYEIILTGVLKQNLDFKTYKLT